eukprot:8412033-Alexandrium_andersonii.AAC.1
MLNMIGKYFLKEPLIEMSTHELLISGSRGDNLCMYSLEDPYIATVAAVKEVLRDMFEGSEGACE